MEQSFKNYKIFLLIFSFSVRLAHTEKLEAFSRELEMVWQEIDHLLHWRQDAGYFHNLSTKLYFKIWLGVDCHSLYNQTHRATQRLSLDHHHWFPCLHTERHVTHLCSNSQCFHLAGKLQPLMLTEFLNLETWTVTKQRCLVGMLNLAKRS